MTRRQRAALAAYLDILDRVRRDLATVETFLAKTVADHLKSGDPYYETSRIAMKAGAYSCAAETAERDLGRIIGMMRKELKIGGES